MNVADMLAEYEVSHFASRDFIDPARILTPGQKEAAERAYDADPIRSLMENVHQSRDDVSQTATRMHRAKQDGLLDRDMYKTVNKEEKRRWRNAVATLKGDHARALAELAHWRDYVRWAQEEAEAADVRLPPEAAE